MNDMNMNDMNNKHRTLHNIHNIILSYCIILKSYVQNSNNHM